MTSPLNWDSVPRAWEANFRDGNISIRALGLLEQFQRSRTEGYHPLDSGEGCMLKCASPTKREKIAKSAFINSGHSKALNNEVLKVLPRIDAALRSQHKFLGTKDIPKARLINDGLGAFSVRRKLRGRAGRHEK